ncbi:MAG: VWA domain-containing protein [Rhodospirillales bacterium]
MNDNQKFVTKIASTAEVDTFLRKLDQGTVRAPQTRGRLLFALDATGSRQATWDRAAHIQTEMFLSAQSLGGLKIQLCFYRGYGEFKVSPWLAEAAPLLRMMTSVSCRAGETQIGRVLRHAANEAASRRVSALVFVGDCCEEMPDALATRTGRLAAFGVPAFMFHEGNDLRAAAAFREIARITGGAYSRFDASSPDALRQLLCAVAVYAAGGGPALLRHAASASSAVKRLAHQMAGGREGR